MTVGLIIGLICAGIAIGMLLTPLITRLMIRIINKRIIWEQSSAEKQFAEWLLEETEPCERCTHCRECNDPETYVEGAPLPPKEKCIEGIIAYTRREATGKENGR